MRNIEDNISLFVEDQFPAFYKDEGANFVEFAKEYYRFLESSNNALSYSRNLIEYRDIDRTIDDFVVHFKEKYLKYFPLELAAVEARFLLKHIMDFYRSKGSQRSYEILFKSVYNTTPTLYYPKEDLFKLSDGTWYKPVYLEVTETPNIALLKRKQIIGQTSGAVAFVESIVKHRVNGKFVSVMYLSDVQGTFDGGEIISASDTTTVLDNPIILGSLSSVEIITGGEGFVVGDLLNVTTGTGRGAVLRVSEIATETGIVRFTLVDGGFGYTNTASVLISQKVLDCTGNTEDFVLFTPVVQPQGNIDFSSSNATFVAEEVINGFFANGVLAGNATILSISYDSAANGTMLVSPGSGNVANGQSGIIYNVGNTKQLTVDSYTDTTASGNLMGSNATSLGVINVTGTFVSSNGNYIYSTIASGNTTINVFSSVSDVSLGSGANFEIGSLTNTETARLDPEYLRNTNTGNVEFQDILVDGSNSNAAGYGFPKAPGAGYNSTILDCLRIDDYVVGTIASLTSINGGQSYTRTPFVRVYDDLTAGYDKRDFIVGISTPTQNFFEGEFVEQSSNGAATVLTVNSFAGNTALDVGEYIYQSNGTSNIATGFVYSGSIDGSNATITVVSVSGTFQNTSLNGYEVATLTSGTNSDIIAVNNSVTIATTCTGIVKENSNTSVLYIKRLSMFETFGIGNTVIGSDSGAVATITSVVQDDTTLNLGNNATVSANVVVANGTVVSATVEDAGFGYVADETVTAVNQSNTASAISARIGTLSQGVGEGYYTSNRGFASSDKFLHDGEYYQNFSYEIQSKIPFDVYKDVLRQVVHVAGTKMLAKFVHQEEANVSITSESSLEIQ